MLVGMLTLWPAWTFAAARAGLDPAGWSGTIEATSAVMTAAMAVPMVGWMRHRGHRWAHGLEMSLAMYAGFAVLLPWYWAGLLAPATVLGAGHLLMLLFMLVAVLLRRHDHALRASHGELPVG